MVNEKANKLVDELKRRGEAYGFVLIAGTVALVGPPDLRSTPVMSNESDLKEAVHEGLLQKTTWTISNHTGKSWTHEVYVLPRA